MSMILIGILLFACVRCCLVPYQTYMGADYQTLSDSPSENELAREISRATQHLYMHLLAARGAGAQVQSTKEQMAAATKIQAAKRGKDARAQVRSQRVAAAKAAEAADGPSAAGRPSVGSTLPKGSPPKGAGSTLPKGSPQKGSPPRSTSPQKPSTTHPEGVQHPIGSSEIGKPGSGASTLQTLHETIREQELALQRLVPEQSPYKNSRHQQEAVAPPHLSCSSPLSPPSSQGILVTVEKAAADLAAAADDALACAFAFATGLDLDRLSSPLSMSEISKLLTEAALACVVDWATGRLLRADLVSTSECSLSPSTNCVIGSSGSRRIFVESDASDSESLSVCGGGPSSPRRVAVA